MGASTRQQVLLKFVSLVELIRTANGYQTEAGEHVYFGDVPELGPNDPEEAIAIVPGTEEPTWIQDGLKCQVRLPVNFAAVARADITMPYLAIERLIADIKRAVERSDRYLGDLVNWPVERGIVATLPREPGSTVVGTTVIYNVRWDEGWGNP